MRFLTIIFIGIAFAGFSQKVNTSLTYSVNLPAETKTNTPVLIMLHGYGSNESDLFDLAKVLDPRFITFSLRAPYTTKAGGYAWFDLQITGQGEKKYNYNEAVVSRKSILSFISNACKAYNVDSLQVYLIGFSQGAIMCYDIALASPDKIKGIVALSGRLMEESKKHLQNDGSASRLKIFIGHGNSDNVISINESKAASEFLTTKRKVKEITFNSYEMPHSINSAELNDIKIWLSKQIGPRKNSAGKK